jgi:hypothetical protein
MAWDNNLTHHIALNDGTKLRTLKQAGDRISTLTNSPLLEDAIVLLIRASTSGESIDVEAATKMVEVVLLAQGSQLAPSVASGEKRKGERLLESQYRDSKSHTSIRADRRASSPASLTSGLRSGANVMRRW